MYHKRYIALYEVQLAKLKKTPARFWATKTGNEPVREWLKKRNATDRKSVGIDIAAAEYGWPVGMPISRPLIKGLFEIRTSLTSNRISRMLFAIVGKEMVLLHRFIKKTQKTLKRDIDLPLNRLKEIK